MRTALTRIVIVASMAACFAACASTGPASPDSGAPGPVGATITILSGGSLSVAQVMIATGQSVAFVNNDNIVHEIDSDPHPTHTDCPSINAVDLVQPGQMKTTNALTVVRTCGFHDHGNPTNTKLQGQIVIQ